jgi:hypothetical protein
MADDESGPPPHSHLIDFPEALDVFFGRIGEMKLVLGPAAAPDVDRAAELLREALAARERGDGPTAVARIGQAMDQLAALADRALPQEAPALRAMAQVFRQAMGRGAVSEAKGAADVMRERSGSVLTPKKRT